ncbi:hypothetical protein EON66_00765, partial [archaeon]
ALAARREVAGRWDAHRLACLDALQSWSQVTEALDTVACTRQPAESLGMSADTARVVSLPATRVRVLDVRRRCVAAHMLVRQRISESFVQLHSEHAPAGIMDWAADDTLTLQAALVSPVCDDWASGGDAPDTGAGSELSDVSSRRALLHCVALSASFRFHDACVAAQSALLHASRVFAAVPSTSASARSLLVAALHPLLELEEGMLAASGVSNLLQGGATGEAAVAGGANARASVRDVGSTLALWQQRVIAQPPLPPLQCMQIWDDTVAVRELMACVVRRLPTPYFTQLLPRVESVMRTTFAQVSAAYRRAGELSLARRYLTRLNDLLMEAGAPRSPAIARLWLELGEAYARRHQNAGLDAAPHSTVQDAGTVSVAGARTPAGGALALGKMAFYAFQNANAVENVLKSVRTDRAFIANTVMPSICEAHGCVDVAAAAGDAGAMSALWLFTRDMEHVAADALADIVMLLLHPLHVHAAQEEARRNGRETVLAQTLAHACTLAEASTSGTLARPPAGFATLSHWMPPSAQLRVLTPGRTAAHVAAVAHIKFAQLLDHVLQVWEQADVPEEADDRVAACKRIVFDAQSLLGRPGSSSSSSSSSSTVCNNAAITLTSAAQLAARVAFHTLKALEMWPPAFATGVASRVSATSKTDSPIVAKGEDSSASPNVPASLDACGLQEAGDAASYKASALTAVQMLPRVFSLVSSFPLALQQVRAALQLDAVSSTPEEAFPLGAGHTHAIPATGSGDDARTTVTGNATDSDLALPSIRLRPICVPAHVFLPWIDQLLALVAGDAVRAIIAPAMPPPAASPLTSGGAGHALAPAMVGAVGKGIAHGAACAHAFAAILGRVGACYPQAVYYPLRMSSSIFSSSAAKCAAGAQHLIQRATAALAPVVHRLSYPLLDLFVDSLEMLHNPDMKLADWLSHAMTLVTEAQAKGADLVTLRDHLLIELQERCFKQYRDTVRGKCVDEWARKHYVNVDRGIREVPAASLLQKLAALRQVVAGGGMRAAGLGSHLSEYSAWLGSFSASDWVQGSASIEIPGQYDVYDGTCAPRVAEHATLASCDQKVRVMASLRQPKRIAFVSSMGRVHAFLAKGGEDLRTDQRIEKLFDVANRVLQRDASIAAVSGLRIRTYAVVPITPVIGLIEWVPATVPLKALIEDTANARLRAAPSRGAASKAASAVWSVRTCDAASERTKWLNKYASALPEEQRRAPGKLYMELNARSTHADACAAWERVMTHMPIDLLRAHLCSMSSSADAFFVLRTRFVRSLCAFNAVAYVCGIGDRHWDNWLLHKYSADIVPIDFGAAFGVGTSMLPVPESIPIRVTPQFVGVLQPMPALPVFAVHMSNVLSALSGEAGRREFLTALSVFAEEPTLDWVSAAKRAHSTTADSSSRVRASPPIPQPQPGSASDGAAMLTVGGAAGTMSNTASESEVTDTRFSGGGWYARVKVLLAAMKLRRANPAPLLYFELLMNSAYCPPPDRRARVVSVYEPLLRNMKAMLLGTYCPSAHPRAQPNNTSAAFRMTLAEQRLLERAVGAPVVEPPPASASGAGAVRASSVLSVPFTECASVSAQVECLLDMATDPAILVRQWEGLATWA